jgi:hypothetical protein
MTGARGDAAALVMEEGAKIWPNNVVEARPQTDRQNTFA